MNRKMSSGGGWGEGAVEWLSVGNAAEMSQFQNLEERSGSSSPDSPHCPAKCSDFVVQFTLNRNGFLNG